MVGKIKGLDATTLKLIALVAMTIDHIGYIFYPKVAILRVIGRIAFPIFAYMIAEGCRYTKHKRKYLSLVFGIGALCSVATYLAQESMFQSIFITFAFSISIIFGMEGMQNEYVSGNLRKSIGYGMLTTLMLGSAFLLCNGNAISGFEIDYGFWGIMTPVLVWIAKEKKQKLIVLGLLLVATTGSEIQIFSLGALVLLALYNGKRGKGMGKLFYVYYPAHLAVLYGLSYIVIGSTP